MMGIAADVAERLRDQTKALADAGDALWEGVQNAFEAEGPNWQPLTAFTIAERRRLGFGPGPILQRTRRYRRSFIVRARGNQVTIGSEDPRAARLNAVRPVVLSERDQLAVADAITRVFTGQGGAAR